MTSIEIKSCNGWPLNLPFPYGWLNQRKVFCEEEPPCVPAVLRLAAYRELGFDGGGARRGGGGGARAVREV
jgi:hypothetical protein